MISKEERMSKMQGNIPFKEVFHEEDGGFEAGTEGQVDLGGQDRITS